MEQEEHDQLEQVQDSRFAWVTGANDNRYYYSQWWIQGQFRDAGKGCFCVIKRHDNRKYYVSYTEDDTGKNDIGPFNSLEDAASVCVMKNYGN